MSYRGLETACTKHPDQKLTLLNTAQGQKKCPLCVVKESLKSDNPSLKDRYCQKHPGYEKLFFCEQDLKGICEKCLDIHEAQSHSVFTIALQSRQCRKEFKEFKGSFKEQKDFWETNYQVLQRIKQKIQKETDRVQDEIEGVFNEIERIIFQQKKMIKDSYLAKCQHIYSSFDNLFMEFYKSYSGVAKMNENVGELDYLYNNYNDYDVVKEYLVRQNRKTFKTYCDEIKDKLKEYQHLLSSVQGTISQKFNFTNTLKDQDVINLVNTCFKAEVYHVENAFGDYASNHNRSMGGTKSITNNFMSLNQSINQSNRTILEHIQGEQDEPSIRNIMDQENDIHINMDNIRNDEEVKTDQFITNDRGEPQLLAVRVSSIKQTGNSSKRSNSITQQKLFKGTDQFLYHLDRAESKLKCITEEFYREFNLQFPGLKDSKSIMVDGVIYLFDNTDATFSNQINVFDNDKKQFTSLDIQLGLSRRKISLCQGNNRYIYFTGEFENNKADRAVLERYDALQNTFEEIYGLSSSQGSFILSIVNDRTLYAFPVMINTQKTQQLDLKQLDETLSFSNKRANMHPTKPNAFIPKWQKINHKLPLNFRVILSNKSQAIQVNHEEILLTGQKTSYIYNFKKDEFTHYINNIAEDEFLDGLYKSLGNTTQVLGFGNSGLHIFDCMARKWTLFDEISVRVNQD